MPVARQCLPLVLSAAAALMAIAAPLPAAAQLYRDRTITMIVNYPAGGPTDIEARIIAQHLPGHIAGRPTVVVKNVGGGGGLIGSNQLGDALPNGDTIGFFTLDTLTQIVGTPAIRTAYSDFVVIGAVESPLVVYMRRDTPPGVTVPADLLKTGDFKALSLNVQNINTMNQALALDLLGIKYQPIPAYRGLKEVETAILQNIGQLANSSLSGWRGSVEPTMGNVVIPLWQLAPRGKNGTYPRSRALPDMPTFEEFYASVNGGKSPAGKFVYTALRTLSDPQLAMFRVAVMPPKAASDAVTAMRSGFEDLWKDERFLADYSRVIKTEPIFVSGGEGQDVLADLGKVPREVRDYIVDYGARMTAK
jgi:hypothetical protein